MTPETIRETRLERGLTQEQAANEIGVSTAAVSRWESGGRDPARSPALIRSALERWLAGE